jgi:hypothetical protein
MEVYDLNKENKRFYESYFGADMIENIGRTFYRGIIVVFDDRIVAGMVWHYKDYELDKKGTVSRIEWLRIDDEKAEEELFAAYKERIMNGNAVTSEFVIPTRGKSREKAALKRQGFTVKLTEGDDIIVSLPEIMQLPFAKKGDISPNVMPLNMLSVRQFRRMTAKCMKSGIKGLCEDLLYLPLDFFDMNISCYCKDKDSINGMILFHRKPSGIIAIQLLAGVDENAQKALAFMMKWVIATLVETYPPDTKILIDRHNQSSLQLTEKLFPRGFGIPVYYGTRNET